MNRSLTLLVALVAFATQVLVLPTQADEPTPARRPTNRQVNHDGRPAQATAQAQDQRVSTRRTTASVPENSTKRNQPIGSGVSKAANKPQVANGSRNNLQQASATTRRNSTNVAQASHNVVSETYDEGYNGGEYVVEDGGGYIEGDASCDTCGSGTCGGLACGSPCRTNWGFDLCNPGRGNRQLCICLPSHGWAQMDYLMWWQRGMNIPPLLTRQATNTTIPNLVLGNEDILTDRMNGGRIRFGWWFANNPNVGVELEYLGIGESTYSFRQAGVGPEIFARPFFNTETDAEDSQLVSRTGLSGVFNVRATSQFDGAAVRFRKSLCCGSGCAFSPIACGSVPTQSRIDATLGWRFFQLKEGLTINEDLVQSPAGTAFRVTDNFTTRNQFNGGELGILWQGRRGYWSMDALMRTSIGNTLQTVSIAGATLINGATPAGPTGGLLAQQSNIGTYTKNSFGVVPELGLNLGYQLTPRWRANAGYNFIYWSNVVRPGDQIDTDLNPNQIPPATLPVTGANRPRFTLRETDYWIQGINLGLEYRW